MPHARSASAGTADLCYASKACELQPRGPGKPIEPSPHVLLLLTPLAGLGFYRRDDATADSSRSDRSWPSAIPVRVK